MDTAPAVEPVRRNASTLLMTLTVVLVAAASYVLLVEIAMGIGDLINYMNGDSATPSRWLGALGLIILGVIGPVCAFLLWRLSRRRGLGIAHSLRRASLGAFVGIVGVVPLLVLAA